MPISNQTLITTVIESRHDHLNPCVTDDLPMGFHGNKMQFIGDWVVNYPAGDIGKKGFCT
jgi:hypothetical protein